jgi:hypothetical protein
MKQDAIELLDPEWPEVVYEETEWPDGILDNVAEAAEPDDKIREMISFLLQEGREMGW